MAMAVSQALEGNGKAGNALDVARKGVRVLRTAGPRGTAQRVARDLYQRIDAPSLDFPLRAGDVADSRKLQLRSPGLGVDRDRRLRIGWVSTPPGLGSGGHTTMFRMVTALEAAGHECTMFLYDRSGRDVREYEAKIRQGWPAVRARVLDASHGITGVDACVATSWPTAHILALRGDEPMRRLYFIQDFEPFFYPRGTEYALAEDTYRFGFRSITIGHMLAGLLHERFGFTADVVDFGCDDVYRLGDPGPRDGVVFYTKPMTARRGFRLGVLALEELRRRRPDVPIHTVGHPDVRLPFAAINHGVCSPQELSAIYNQTRAGVALSFSNITLLAEEFLACGTVPVINDTFDFSADVSTDAGCEYVRWAPATPSGLADELLDVLENPPDPAAVARTARRELWRPAQAAFVRAVEDETYAG
jgi:O-antigen biosynthesis protein